MKLNTECHSWHTRTVKSNTKPPTSVSSWIVSPPISCLSRNTPGLRRLARAPPLHASVCRRARRISQASSVGEPALPSMPLSTDELAVHPSASPPRLPRLRLPANPPPLHASAPPTRTPPLPGFVRQQARHPSMHQLRRQARPPPRLRPSTKAPSLSGSLLRCGESAHLHAFLRRRSRTTSPRQQILCDCLLLHGIQILKVPCEWTEAGRDQNSISFVLHSQTRNWIRLIPRILNGNAKSSKQQNSNCGLMQYHHGFGIETNSIPRSPISTSKRRVREINSMVTFLCTHLLLHN
jgi:hypothetical protein